MDSKYFPESLKSLKPTSLLFPTLHKFPALPFLPAPFRSASLNQYSSRTNANKHLRINHHIRVLVSRGLYKALLYFTYFTLLYSRNYFFLNDGKSLITFIKTHDGM